MEWGETDGILVLQELTRSSEESRKTVEQLEVRYRNAEDEVRMLYGQVNMGGALRGPFFRGHRWSKPSVN